MSISSQLPPLSLAQTSATLRALAQSVGQTVEARVLGQQPNGLTQVQIGRQVLSLNLPTQSIPGTTLALAVQQAEGQLRLTVISSLAPTSSSTGTRTASPAPATPVATPATQVQISTQLASPQSSTASVPAAVNAPPGPSASAVAPPATQGTAPVTAPPSTPLASTPAAQGGTQAVPASVAAPVAGAIIGAAGRPAMPYATAIPGAPPAVAALPGAATNAMPAVQQTLASSSVGQHASAPAQAGAGKLAAPPAGAPAASTPQAALTQMVQQSVPGQNSIVGLTSTIAAVAGRVALPEAVAQAAQRVLGHRLSLDGGRLDGAALQKTIQGSGIFQEALLAAGRPAAAAGDLKSSLLNLQQKLDSWLGTQGAVEQVARVPPPIRGVQPRLRNADQPPPPFPQTAEEAGKQLQEQTHAALARLRLHQNASLPDGFSSRQEAQWSLDLPIVMGNTQALLQMQIHHDGENDTTHPEDRGWQVRFAINLSELGEVGAQISLRAKTTGVMLWAERQETADLLSTSIAELRDDLEGVGLVPGTVIVRAGAPAQPPPPSPTHLLDEVR